MEKGDDKTISGTQIRGRRRRRGRRGVGRSTNICIHTTVTTSGGERGDRRVPRIRTRRCDGAGVITSTAFTLTTCSGIRRAMLWTPFPRVCSGRLWGLQTLHNRANSSTMCTRPDDTANTAVDGGI